MSYAAVFASLNFYPDVCPLCAVNPLMYFLNYVHRPIWPESAFLISINKQTCVYLSNIWLQWNLNKIDERHTQKVNVNIYFCSGMWIVHPKMKCVYMYESTTNFYKLTVCLSMTFSERIGIDIGHFAKDNDIQIWLRFEVSMTSKIT